MERENKKKTFRIFQRQYSDVSSCIVLSDPVPTLKINVHDGWAHNPPSAETKGARGEGKKRRVHSAAECPRPRYE